MLFQSSLEFARLFLVAKRCLLLMIILILIFGLCPGCIIYILFLLMIHIGRINLAPLKNHDAVIKPKTEKSSSSDFQLIGHRGAGFDAPENTLEAIRKAYENGACAVEVDITFTKDGIPAIFHDDTVDRTTDGSGSVGNFTMAELRELNAAAKHRTQFERVAIPELEDVIKECLRLNLNIYFDCKGVLDAKKNTAALLKMYEKYPELYQKSAVCSFFPNLIYWLHRKDPNIVVGLTHRELFVTYKDDYKTPKNAYWMTPFLYIWDRLFEWLLFSWFWYVCGNSLWLMHTGHVTKRFINEWREYGIETVIWVPNDQNERRYFGEHLKCPIIVDTLDENYSDKKTV